MRIPSRNLNYPTAIKFGAGRIRELADHCKANGITRPLFVTDPGLAGMPMVGKVLLTCLAIHLVPRTAVLGAVLLTGYFGGAIASHVRVGNPLFTHTLFPIYIAILIWGGLFLRDARVKAMLARKE